MLLTPFHMSFSNVTFLHTAADTIAAAREWLMDCFPDDQDEIEEATDRTIVRETHRHYGGGWDGFIRAR
jgi:hypothetical protein